MLETDKKGSTAKREQADITEKECLYLQMHCIAITFLRELLLSNQHVRRKQLHCRDIKTMSQLSSTNLLQA